MLQSPMARPACDMTYGRLRCQGLLLNVAAFLISLVRRR